MDGILALGHFCETHGPCVILCTQRCSEEPKQVAPTISSLICEACQSLDVKQALVSRDEKCCYVTIRTPLQPNLAFLLKQAVVRSLSCEETSNESGLLYFGDNERGHVLSHTFNVQDSLARGFQRKYCILMLMQDKIHLLNCWPFLTKHIRKVSAEVQDKAVKVNNVEQQHKSQRAVRQAQTSLGCPGRSLSQLTGEPAIFAHFHLWFVWLLNTELFIEKPFKPPEVPAECLSVSTLRRIFKRMSPENFRILCYCYLTGIQVQSEDNQIESVFRQLLPKKFKLPESGEKCLINKRYEISWHGMLPQKLPTLVTSIETALADDNLPENALDPHIVSIITHWFNIACVMSWTSNSSSNKELFRSLEVQKHDMPLLSYWAPQCKEYEL
ncbi:hypothetical protein ABEB36_001147 [Hypothenemus hampei]|uniref:UDENN FLCN/SMCR8-type domain-containing protein n=1 Tax=Hypothenemus hampei TaxID=57062 RepID=A0ABD1FDN0_HYPHA